MMDLFKGLLDFNGDDESVCPGYMATLAVRCGRCPLSSVPCLLNTHAAVYWRNTCCTSQMMY